MSFWELALIAIIALIVLGPERLPKAARTIGLWVGKAKHGFDSIKNEIDRELKVKELQEQLLAQKQQIENNTDLNSIKEELNNSVNSIHDQAKSLKNSVADEKPSNKTQISDNPGKAYQPTQTDDVAETSDNDSSRQNDKT